MSTSYCKKCKARVDPMMDHCPSCLAPTNSLGPIKRFFAWLFGRGPQPRRSPGSLLRRVLGRPHTQVEWRARASTGSDSTTIRIEENGKVHEYDRWEDVPPKWQNRLQAVTGELGLDDPGEAFAGSLDFDDLPEDVKRRIRAIRRGDGEADSETFEFKSSRSFQMSSSESLAGDAVTRTFTVRGPDGVERTYHSLDEMPAEIRSMFERLHG